MMVARYFGEDITYDAVENRTRVYRKKAKELAEEAQAAGRMEQNMRVKSANTTPRKPKTMSKSVLDGGRFYTPSTARDGDGKLWILMSNYRCCHRPCHEIDPDEEEQGQE